MEMNTNESRILTNGNFQNNALHEIRQINIYIENTEKIDYNIEHIEKKLFSILGAAEYTECGDGFVDWRYTINPPLHIRESYVEQFEMTYETLICLVINDGNHTKVEVKVSTQTDSVVID